MAAPRHRQAKKSDSTLAERAGICYLCENHFFNHTRAM